MEWFIIAFIGWSITSILVNGTIFDEIRVYLQVKAPVLAKLMTCMQCSGFWVGILIGILGYSKVLENPMDLVVSANGYIGVCVTVFLYGLYISGASVLLNGLVVFFFKKNPMPEINIGEIKKTDEQETT